MQFNASGKVTLQAAKNNTTYSKSFQLNGRERKHLINTCSIVFIKDNFDLSRILEDSLVCITSFYSIVSL